MNQQQKNYIKKRIAEILQTKIHETRNALTTEAKTITINKKVSLIRAGKVKLRSDKEIFKLDNYRYGINQLERIFDFSDYEQPREFDNKAFNEKSALLKRKANEITDKVMLGDSSEALALVAEFENFTV